LSDLFRSRPEGATAPERPRTRDEVLKPVDLRRPGRTQRSAWPAVLGLVALGLLVWWVASRPRAPSVAVRRAPRISDFRGVGGSGLDVSGNLERAFAPGSTERLPQTYDLSDVKFQPGTAQLVWGKSMSLGQVADVLKRHPQARVRVDGFTTPAESVQS